MSMFAQLRAVATVSAYAPCVLPHPKCSTAIFRKQQRKHTHLHLRHWPSALFVCVCYAVVCVQSKHTHTQAGAQSHSQTRFLITARTHALSHTRRRCAGACRFGRGGGGVLRFGGNAQGNLNDSHSLDVVHSTSMCGKSIPPLRTQQ